MPVIGEAMPPTTPKKINIGPMIKPIKGIGKSANPKPIETIAIKIPIIKPKIAKMTVRTGLKICSCLAEIISLLSMYLL